MSAKLARWKENYPEYLLIDTDNPPDNPGSPAPPARRLGLCSRSQTPS
ncbi:MAG: hypothetical protein U5L04_03330 [Trueperaceae bacterium]|nr:hypothetical protein [Trueperaceae bacterium]